jgi:hypothetical protein
LETAKELRAALDRAIAAAEFEEAEVRGKGAVPRSFGQRDMRDERVARASAAAVAVGEGRRQSFSTLIDDFNTPGLIIGRALEVRPPPVKRHTENPTYL